VGVGGAEESAAEANLGLQVVVWLDVVHPGARFRAWVAIAVPVPVTGVVDILHFFRHRFGILPFFGRTFDLKRIHCSALVAGAQSTLCPSANTEGTTLGMVLFHNVAPADFAWNPALVELVVFLQKLLLTLQLMGLTRVDNSAAEANLEDFDSVHC